MFRNSSLKNDNDKNPKTDEDIGILEAYECEDWDGDGISNYVEVENSADYNFDPLAKNTIDSYPQGTHGDGRLFNGLRLPNDGKGFYHFYGGDAINTDNYFVAETLEKLLKISKIWSEKHPDLAPLMINVFTGQNGNQNLDVNDDDKNGTPDPINPQDTENRFGLGDCSRQNGGPMCWGPPPDCHNSHENGLDLDVRYVRKDEQEAAGIKLTDADNKKDYYNQELSIEAVKLFRDNDAIRIFTVSQSGVTADAVIQYIDGHHDHFHVAFANPNPPTGQIEINFTPPAAGETECVVTAGPVKDRKGLNLFKGFMITVSTSNPNTKIQYDSTSKNSLNIPLDENGQVIFTVIKNETGAMTTTIKVETPNKYNQSQAVGSKNIAFP